MRPPHAALVAAVETATKEHQPYLEISACEPVTIVEGIFVLSGPEGPFDQFEVRIEVGPKYPSSEPRVFETAGRIPRTIERHVYDDGSCCLVVWEQWLAVAKDTSFSSFLEGPLKQFLLSQVIFEQTKKWRFGERPHGTAGMIEAYAEILGVKPKKTEILSRLELLAHPWPKGHWLCPCGSGRIIRKCPREELWSLHQRIPPGLAKQMLRKLGVAFEIDAKNGILRRRLAKAKKRNLNSVVDAALPLRNGQG